MRPKAKVRVRRCVEVGLMKRNRSILRRPSGQTNGICAGMDRNSVRETARPPTPILKPIHQVICVERKVCLGVEPHGAEERGSANESQSLNHSHKSTVMKQFSKDD